MSDPRPGVQNQRTCQAFFSSWLHWRLRRRLPRKHPGNPDSLAKLVESDTVTWGRISKGTRIEPR